MNKNYLKFGGLIVGILSVLGWLAYEGVAAGGAYYKTVPELRAMGEAATAKRIRVGGDVVPGSIVRHGQEVKFTLMQKEQDVVSTLNVVYTGIDPLPDTFKDGSQALADGKLGADGIFQAKAVQAKCASKYEAKPPVMKPANNKPTA